MLTIDGSDSISDDKWNELNQAIKTFIKHLSDEDMIATIIFNENKIECVTEPPK